MAGRVVWDAEPTKGRVVWDDEASGSAGASPQGRPLMSPGEATFRGAVDGVPMAQDVSAGGASGVLHALRFLGEHGIGPEYFKNINPSRENILKNERAALAQADQDRPGWTTLGKVGGAGVSMLAPGLNAIRAGQGANLATRIGMSGAQAGAYGTLHGFGSGDGLEDRFYRAGTEGTLGALLGMGGQAVLGEAVPVVAGSIARKAAERSARATAQIDDLAKASAGEVTASARSAAGTSATAAYKNATNIEEALKAGAMTLDDLTPEQLTLYRGLLKERALKAARDLPADASRKTTKGAEYSEALATEGARTADAAKRIGNPIEQVGPRLRRYGAPLLGKAAGGLLGYELGDGDPLWAILGAGLGGAAGGFNRPMQHALTRMVQHPSVQRPIWNTAARLSRAAGVTNRFAAPASRPTALALTPEVRSMLAPAMAGGEEERPRTLAELLAEERWR